MTEAVTLPGLAKLESAGTETVPVPSFADPDVFDWLEAATQASHDAAPYGIVGMALDGTVARYNAAEGNLSGLTPARVIGRQFFTSVAPCTNNFMVAHRFETEIEIDALVDYVFTFRIAPLRVRLRLLKRPRADLMYLLVEKRD
jgi:photoactive yellow protein